MNVEFVTGDQNTEAIREFFKEKSPLKLAVAFWGEHAVKLLHEKNQEIQVICNLESGATNPVVIKKLRDHRNIHFRSCPNLHAKVYWSASKVIVSSANCSANGLSYEDGEIFGWIEAGTVLQDPKIVKKAEEWFEKLWNSLTDVTDEQLELANERWKQKRCTRLPKSMTKISLLSAFRENPGAFKDKNISFLIWAEDSHEKDKEAVKTAIDKGIKGLHTKNVDWYVDWDSIPEDTYLINFRYDGKRATKLMLSKSLPKHIVLNGYENSKITIMPKVLTIEDIYFISPDDEKFIKSIAPLLWKNAFPKDDEDGRIINIYEAKEILLANNR